MTDSTPDDMLPRAELPSAGELVSGMSVFILFVALAAAALAPDKGRER